MHRGNRELSWAIYDGAGAGSQTGNNAPVFAIEPHEEFRGVLGGTFGPQDRAAFFRNMLRRRAWETVRLVNLPSAVAVQGWVLPVSLLWIDGDHRYEGVRNDFQAWLSHVKPNGIIALHDTIPADGGPGPLSKKPSPRVRSRRSSRST